MKTIGTRKERHEKMNQKRSRTNDERTLELEMLMNARNYRFFKKIPG